MKIFILTLLFSNITFAEVVTSPTEKELESKDNSTKEAEASVYTDEDGDQITMLDKELRNKTRATMEIVASHIYDGQLIKETKTEFIKEVLTDKTVSYGEYIVVKGDTLMTISQKIYGTTKRWKEIQVLNEKEIGPKGIKINQKLKYQITTEKVEAEIEKKTEN